MSVQNALNAAIYSKLSGSASLVAALGGTAVYFQQAPEGAPLPFVVWSYQAGGDENATPRRTVNQIILMRSFSGTASQAGSIDGIIDGLLHGHTLTVSGWSNNFWLMREQEINLVENLPSTLPVFVTSALYRVRLEKD
jgi:hypothetical protein